MAREDLRELYRRLVASELDFMPRGRTGIECIYAEVVARYGSLCDDGYLCADNCNGGHEQPEWKHVVRKALDFLRRATPSVQKGTERGSWVFQ